MNEYIEKINKVVFKTKGKWYLASEVDDFLDEIVVGIETISRENDELKAKPQNQDISEDKTAELQNEIQRLKAELANKSQVAAAPAAETELPDFSEKDAEIEALKVRLNESEIALKVLTEKFSSFSQAKPQEETSDKPEFEKTKAPDEENEKLKAERDELIENIRVLKRFRDNFKSAIKNDMANIANKFVELESDKLL